MHSVEQASKVIQQQLDIHFSRKFPAPQVKVYSNPQTFFNYYTGINKKRSMEAMMKLDAEVTYYYDDSNHEIMFKGFRRDGDASFKELKSQTIRMGSLVHEFIHNVQVLSGGYSKYNLTDEGCCEIVAFVITADIPHVSDYSTFISILWNLLDYSADTPDEKYKMIRDYNVAQNKTKVANQWLDNFLESNKHLKLTRGQLSSQCENPENMNEKLWNILNKYQDEEIANEFYKLHDGFKSKLLEPFQ